MGFTQSFAQKCLLYQYVLIMPKKWSALGEQHHILSLSDGLRMILLAILTVLELGIDTSWDTRLE